MKRCIAHPVYPIRVSHISIVDEVTVAKRFGLYFASVSLKSKTTFQQSNTAQLLAIGLGVLPIYALAFMGGIEMVNSGEFSIPGVADSMQMVVFETLLFGGLLTLLLYLMCGDNLASLQLKTASLADDFSSGIVITFILLGSLMLLGLMLNAFSFNEVPDTNIALAEALAANPLLLAIWLGPVIIIKAAVLEEFTRVFLLTRLWKVWSSPEDKEAAVVLSALLFGLGHIYQGAVGVVGTALIGYILGKAYLKGGRFLPLVIGHALYDITVLLALVTMVRTGTLETL